jgi:hypothetical protein
MHKREFLRGNLNALSRKEDEKRRKKIIEEVSCSF